MLSGYNLTVPSLSYHRPAEIGDLIKIESNANHIENSDRYNRRTRALSSGREKFGVKRGTNRGF
jgi:hypothetical protein